MSVERSGSAGRAVFLSYASQDAETARRVCDALRAAGVEVWFDQSELRGGDAWDQMIRRRYDELRAEIRKTEEAGTEARSALAATLMLRVNHQQLAGEPSSMNGLVDTEAEACRSIALDSARAEPRAVLGFGLTEEYRVARDQLAHLLAETKP